MIGAVEPLGYTPAFCSKSVKPATKFVQSAPDSNLQGHLADRRRPMTTTEQEREREMQFPFSDMLREINGVMFERPKDVTIKVDSLDKFTAALSASVDLVTHEPKGIVDASFCGVKVTANDLVPPGMAVITHGGEIINIIRYAAA